MVKKINEKRKEKPGKVAKYEGKTKEQIIAAEKRKLGGIYKKLDEKTKKATENLVEEAAFMGASLHELRQKIAEKVTQKNTRMVRTRKASRSLQKLKYIIQ